MFATIAATCVLMVAAFHFAGEAWRQRAPGGARGVSAVLGRRVLGTGLLGVLPVALAVSVSGQSLHELGLGRVDGSSTVWATAALSAVVILVMHRLARQESFRVENPELRTPMWTMWHHVANAMSWAVYLLAYETLYRGVTLLGAIEAIGLAGAVAFSTALYLAAHASRPWSEIAGALVMAPIFAGLALWSGSVWMPWLLHLAIALSADGFGLRAAPTPRCAR